MVDSRLVLINETFQNFCVKSANFFPSCLRCFFTFILFALFLYVVSQFIFPPLYFGCYVVSCDASGRVRPERWPTMISWTSRRPSQRTAATRPSTEWTQTGSSSSSRSEWTIFHVRRGSSSPEQCCGSIPFWTGSGSCFSLLYGSGSCFSILFGSESDRSFRIRLRLLTISNR